MNKRSRMCAHVHNLTTRAHVRTHEICTKSAHVRKRFACDFSFVCSHHRVRRCHSGTSTANRNFIFIFSQLFLNATPPSLVFYSQVSASKCGVLRARGSGAFWVDTSTRRAVPAVGDEVLGTVVGKPGEVSGLRAALPVPLLPFVAVMA